MIYFFRKEMRKWHSVLWVVFASLALGGISSFLLFWHRSPSHMRVASVNGKPVYATKLRHELATVKTYLEQIRSYARLQNVPVDLFLHLYGLSNPQKVALDMCISKTLLEQAQKRLGVYVSDELFKDHLYSILPQYLMQPDGTINVQAYRQYVGQQDMSIVEYEKEQKLALESEMLKEFIRQGNYVPHTIIQEQYTQDHIEKKFAVVKVAFEHFVTEAKKHHAVTDADLADYFKENKETYRTPERRKLDYWIVTPSHYMSSITVSEDTINRFYEKNKQVLFRVPPQVKVRHIFLEFDKKGAKETKQDLAYQLQTQVAKDGMIFETIAKQYSEHKDASKGGLIDFFEKGSFESEFEKAAFRLQTPGDVSPVIKTQGGYEIIQLVERRAASAKPLNAVKEEIIAAIKNKRALQELKQTVKAVIKQSEQSPERVMEFAHKYGLKVKTTEWLEKAAKYDDPLINVLTQEVFTGSKQEKSYGSLIFQDDNVIYQISTIEKTFIPSLKAVKNTVEHDYYKNKAQAAMEKELKQIKQDFFAKHISMEELAKRVGHTGVMTTPFLKRTHLPDKPPHGIDREVLNQAFVLHSPELLLDAAAGDDHYLVQFIAQQGDAGDLSVRRKDEIDQRTSLFTQGFVASLHRLARIEIDQRMLAARTELPTSEPFIPEQEG